jgi:type IV pilus assembly protein PilN
MIRINLAPPDRRSRGGGLGLRIALPRLPEFNLAMAFGVLYLLTALALGAFWWHLSGREEHLISEVQRQTANLTELKARVGQAGKIKEKLAELQKRLDAIQALTKGQNRPVALFDTLADVVPRELWLTGLEERGASLRITGTSFSTTAVSDFMSNLRSSGRFKDVDIILSKQDHSKTPAPVTFEVTCRFES